MITLTCCLNISRFVSLFVSSVILCLADKFHVKSIATTRSGKLWMSVSSICDCLIFCREPETAYCFNHFYFLMELFHILYFLVLMTVFLCVDTQNFVKTAMNLRTSPVFFAIIIPARMRFNFTLQGSFFQCKMLEDFELHLEDILQILVSKRVVRSFSYLHKCASICVWVWKMLSV